MTAKPIDPLLARQLKKLSLPSEVELSPEWERFVAQVNEHYTHMADDRALLSRSIELSTQEMEELRRRFELQQTNLAGVIAELEASLARIALVATAHTYAPPRKDLEVARAVQQLLIPPQATIEMQQMRFAGHFDPAEECGGDWWTVAPLPNGRALVVVGDVTGHGIASAIITGAAKATCDLALQLTSETLTPSRLLAMMNQTLYRMARRKIMMTSVAAVLDPAKRTLTVANAGHPFPLLVRNSITHPIMAEGPQIGDSPRATYEDSTVELHAGDVLALFTDGVTELENDRGERFTERRLRTVVQRTAREGAPRVCNALVEALTQFRGKRPASDDLTLVVTSVG